MQHQNALKTLLQLEVPENAPSVILFVENKSPRLEYVSDFIFHHVLKLNYTITTDKSNFLNSNSSRLNYSCETIPDVLQIVPQGLLNETGVSENKPEELVENNCLYFYPTRIKSNEATQTFQFDVFSSVFYLISRYEEWQSYKPDKHQRFEVDQSCLFKSGFHLKPIVELWLAEFQAYFLKLNPNFVFPTKDFQVLSTIDVDNLYAYQSKGLLRTLGAGMKDILKGDFSNLKQRILVLLNRKKDPFDIYEDVSDFCFENKIPLIYFFLFRTGDLYNRTVNPNSNAFKNVFQSITSNHALIGIHPSYDATYKNGLLKEEIALITEKMGTAPNSSRQHFLRFNIRTTPKQLVENGISFDFSMGYASQAGLRAGTSLPFYYYDFELERKSNLLFVPFCVMDGVYTIYSSIQPNKAYESMLDLAKEIKKVNGLFISVFHERSFSDHLYPGFGTLYKKLHTTLKEL